MNAEAVDAEEKWVIATAIGVQFKSLDKARAWKAYYRQEYCEAE
jgi:hypothetical protein